VRGFLKFRPYRNVQPNFRPVQRFFHFMRQKSSPRRRARSPSRSATPQRAPLSFERNPAPTGHRRARDRGHFVSRGRADHARSRANLVSRRGAIPRLLQANGDTGQNQVARLLDVKAPSYSPHLERSQFPRTRDDGSIDVPSSVTAWMLRPKESARNQFACRRRSSFPMIDSVPRGVVAPATAAM